MMEYEDGPRKLPWDLLHPVVGTRTVEDDEGFPPSSFSWPEDPDERTLVPFWLSLNEYNVLGSTIDVGSDPAFGADALRVLWLWLRNMRIQVPICAAVDDCIENNPTTMTLIVNQLMSNAVFNTYITNQITQNSGGNIYPPRPTTATPEPLCNAATYIVAQLRALISDIYDDLETLSPDEILASLLGILGWRSGPLYQFIGLLETNDKAALLAAYDDASPDLICQLIEAELDQAPVLAWVASNFPPPSVLGDALTLGIQATANEGRWAQWIAVGAILTTADCADCLPAGERVPVIASVWDPAHLAGTLSGPTPEGIWTATSGTRASDEAFALRDQLGRDFVLTDVLYSETPACQVWLQGGSVTHFECGTGNQYTGQTVEEFWTTWTAGGHRTMQFKMVAP